MNPGVVVLWNPGAEALVGYSSEEAIGMPLETIIADQWRPAHRAGVRRFRETGRGPIIDTPAAMAVEGRRSRGDLLSVEITLARLSNGAGAADGTASRGRHALRAGGGA